jgi:streptogramin lyase
MTRCAHAILIAALLCGCAGRDMQSLPAGGAGASSAPMALKIVIPAPSASSGIRPMYVSRNTKGVGISYGAHPATFPTITTPTLAADVSSSSSLCTTNGDGSRTCSIPIPAPVGADDFQITAWDAVPVSGSFSNANRLSGTTVLNRTITAGQANSLSFTLDGVVNSIGLFVSPSSLPAAASGTTQTATLSVNATDRNGNIIIGSGNYTDASGSPLTISISPAVAVSGDTLRTSLSGSTISSSSANTLTVTYSGNSSYGTTFSATPSVSIAGTSGTTTLSISPWLVTEFSNGISSDANLYSITSGPDGNLWFTEYPSPNLQNRIGRITTSGAVTEFSSAILKRAGVYGITSGPDGNLWVTGLIRTYRITTSGTVTEFSGGTDGPNPYITTDPDGNLWFTEVCANCTPRIPNGGRIGRLTPSGTLTEFSTGITAGSAPLGIASGADGNLWFTENSGNRIGRITPSGAVTEFSTGITANSAPYGITTGPDGNLWFTENTGNRIGRITTSGTITEFSSGITPNSNLLNITTGPDGNLWFTEGFIDLSPAEGGKRIGRITPNGVVTEFSSGIIDDPRGITSGPDGNLWFTEFNGRIGRLIY